MLASSKGHYTVYTALTCGTGELILQQLIKYNIYAFPLWCLSLKYIENIVLSRI